MSPARSWKTRIWPSHSGPGADADGRSINLGGDAGGDFPRNAFQDEGRDAGAVEGGGIGQQSVNGGRRLALDLVAAHAMDGLRRESNVSDDGNFGFDDAADERDARGSAFDFDGFGAAFLDEAHGVFKRLVSAGVVGAEGHVSHEKRMLARRGGRRGCDAASHPW